MRKQKTLTINGNRITPNKLRNSFHSLASGGHNISDVNGLEIHWMEWLEGDEIHVYNAGSVHNPKFDYGQKAYFLEDK